LNPVQALQVMLSLQFIRGGHARRCAALASLMPSSDAKQAFQSFMLTLLARRVAAGKHASDADERRVIEDMWLDPLVQRRWQRLALRLSEADCRRIGRLATERGLASSGIRWLGMETATEGWALASAGYATVENLRMAVATTDLQFTSSSFDAVRPGPSRPARSAVQSVDRPAAQASS
jgi:hypothetical protein